jgi:uncharacterized protein YdcH (DUF465 family)
MVANHQEECFSFSKNEHIYECRAPKHENSTNETKNRKRARMQLKNELSSLAVTLLRPA